MKPSLLALVFVTILSIASTAPAISVVLVTDDAGMRALAESDNRGLIRGTVSSVDSKQYGGGPPVIYLHFAGVKNDHVFGAITDPTPWQDLYGRDLSGLVGKTVEIVSKAREKDGGQIYFGTSYYPDFRVIESGSRSPEVARSPVTPPTSASPVNSGKSNGTQEKLTPMHILNVECGGFKAWVMGVATNRDRGISRKEALDRVDNEIRMSHSKAPKEYANEMTYDDMKFYHRNLNFIYDHPHITPDQIGASSETNCPTDKTKPGGGYTLFKVQ